MTEAERSMWADLYRFYERCEKTEPTMEAWQELGVEANRISNAYNNEFFVRDVLATILAVMAERKKLGGQR